MNTRTSLAGLLLLFLAGSLPAAVQGPPVISTRLEYDEVGEHLRDIREQAGTLGPEAAYPALHVQLQAFLASDRGDPYQREALRLSLEASEGLDLAEAHHIVTRALEAAIEFTPRWGQSASLSYQTCLAVGYHPLSELRDSSELRDPTKVHLLLTFHRGLLQEHLVHGEYRRATTELVLALLGEAPPARRGELRLRRRERTAPIDAQDKLGLLTALSSWIVSLPDGHWPDSKAMLDVARALGEARDASLSLRLLAVQRVLAAGLEREVFGPAHEAFARGALATAGDLDPEEALEYLVHALKMEVWG